MPNFTKKVAKYCSGDLHPGETVEGAVFGQPAGSFGRNVGFGAAGLAGSVIADKAARKRKEEHGGATEGGMAESFPTGSVVLAVTPMRFLVFEYGQMAGKPKGLLAEYPLSQIHEVTQEKRKLHRSLLVRFSDNSVVDLDVVKMAKPDEFIEAFGKVKGS